MKRKTLTSLRCPSRKQCAGKLDIRSVETGEEIQYGEIVCERCRKSYPILAGVAVLVPDVMNYCLEHVKGISKSVPQEKIPSAFRRQYEQALKSIEEEHIEEDLESERVNALYLMTHYLSAHDLVTGTPIDEMIQKYWETGPFSVVQNWVPGGSSVVEIGCGVGGLARLLQAKVSTYLGVDSSFQSVALARALNVLAEKRDLKIPWDLIEGTVSKSVDIPVQKFTNVDFIVGDLQDLPIQDQSFDGSITLNTIDMLNSPSVLPEAQFRVAKKDGYAIQTGPYIWADRIAKQLRLKTGMHSKLGQQNGSALAVKFLYKKAGFEIREEKDFVPWLFLKHIRQIELYQVHCFLARKT